MLAKLNEHGDAQKLKRARPNGKPFQKKEKPLKLSRVLH